MNIEETLQNRIERAAKFILEADGLLITAGAGMGVDSGLPDFRGDEGFWKAYPALGELKIDFQRIARPQSFLEDPSLAWGFYGHRLNLYRNTVPHDGFRILREISANMPNGAFVATSNVDGQFQKAGFPDQRIYEVHGSIHRMACMDGNCETLDSIYTHDGKRWFEAEYVLAFAKNYNVYAIDMTGKRGNKIQRITKEQFWELQDKYWGLDDTHQQYRFAIELP